MTLEEAQKEIVDLKEKLSTLEEEKKNLIEEKDKLSQDNETIRQINQQYFLKLTAAHEDEVEDEDNEEIPSCEDFANTLEI